MKKLLLALIIAVSAGPALAQYVPVNGIVQLGGQSVRVGGLPATINTYMQTYPGATVSVCVTNTACASLAPIYTSATGGSKSNPFTSGSSSSAQPASYQFFVAAGTYDIRYSGAGIGVPWTVSSVAVGGGGSGGSSSYPPIVASIAPYTTGCSGDFGCAMTNALAAAYAQGGGTVDGRGFVCPAQCNIGQANLLLSDNLLPTIVYLPSGTITRQTISATGKSAQILYGSNLIVYAYGATIVGPSDVTAVAQQLAPAAVTNVYWYGGSIADNGSVVSGSAAFQIGGPAVNQGLASLYFPNVTYTPNYIAVDPSNPYYTTYFNGALEHLAFYNSALTGAQISTQYTDCQSSVTTCNSDIVAAGAVNHWPLTETSGSTATDVIGGKNGTYTGGYTLNSQAGVAGSEKAALFNGTSGYVALPSMAPFSGGPASVSGWFYFPLAPSAHVSEIFSLSGLTAQNSVSVFYDTATGLAVYITNGGTTDYLPVPEVTLTPGAWMQFAWVLTGGQAFLYINGAQVVLNGTDVTFSRFQDLQVSGADIGIEVSSEHGCTCYNRIINPIMSGNSFGIQTINHTGYPGAVNSNVFDSPVDTMSPIKVYTNGGAKNRWTGTPDFENLATQPGIVLAAEPTLDNPGTGYVNGDVITGSGCITTQPTFTLQPYEPQLAVKTQGVGCSNSTEVSTSGGSGSGMKINMHVTNYMVPLDYANYLDAPYEEGGTGGDYICGSGNSIMGTEQTGNGSTYVPNFCPGPTTSYGGPLSYFQFGQGMTPLSLGLKSISGSVPYISFGSDLMYDAFLTLADTPSTASINLFWNGPYYTGRNAQILGQWGNSEWDVGVSKPHAGTISTGAVTVGAISNPSTPTLTAVGGTGTNSVPYGLVCNDGNTGHTAIVSPVTTVSGPAVLGAFLTMTIGAGGTGYVQADVGSHVTLTGYDGFGSGAEATITQVNGGSGTGAVTGISLYAAGSGYVTLPYPASGATGIFATSGGTGTGLTITGTAAYISIAIPQVNGCASWTVLETDTGHRLQSPSSFATGSTNISLNILDFGNAYTTVSYASTRNTTGDSSFGGYVGVTSGNGYQINGTATAGHYLRGNGTLYVDSPLLLTDAGLASTGTTTAVNVTAATTDTQISELTLTSSAMNTAGLVSSFRARGVYTTQSGQTPTLKFKIKLCTVSGCGSGTALTLGTWTTAATTASVTNDFHLEGDITTLSTGGSGTVILKGLLTAELGATGGTVVAAPTGTVNGDILTDANTSASSSIALNGVLYLDLVAQYSTDPGSAPYNTVTPIVFKFTPY